MLNQGRVLILNVFDNKCQLFFHLLQLQSSDPVPVLDMLLDTVVFPLREVTAKQLQLLVWKHLVEEDIP